MVMCIALPSFGPGARHQAVRLESFKRTAPRSDLHPGNKPAIERRPQLPQRARVASMSVADPEGRAARLSGPWRTSRHSGS